MPIERCTDCGRMVDLDWNGEQIEYIRRCGDIVPVCVNCLTDQELKDLEEE